MIWVIAIIAVIVIYNAEQLPGVINKFKKEVPNIVDTGKKVSKELKEKAQAVAEKKAAKIKPSKDKSEDSE